MNEIDGALIERGKYLRDVVLRLDSEYADLPEGRLYIVKKHQKVHYYLWDNDSPSKFRYIKQSETGLIRGLAQRKYVDDLREACEAEAGAIDSYLSKLPIVRAEELCDSAEEEVRGMIDPIVDNDTSFVLGWERENYTPQLEVSLHDGLETERGEWVKSKSECMIANMLYKNGISYVYEKPLKIGDFLFKPDFTILDVRRRRELFLEHLGMMGDPNYADGAVFKLNIFARAGYYLGDRLLISMETANRPLDIQATEKMVLHALGR